MDMISRMWVWVESMGVASGYGCKEVYTCRFPHITYPYSSCTYSIWQDQPYFLLILGAHAQRGLQ